MFHVSMYLLTMLLFFMALNTSFMMSCGFDWDRMPKCHFAFFTGFFDSSSACDALPVEGVVDVVVGFDSSNVAETSFNSIIIFEISLTYLIFEQKYKYLFFLYPWTNLNIYIYILKVWEILVFSVHDLKIIYF
jgi:hypothetical protein